MRRTVGALLLVGLVLVALGAPVFGADPTSVPTEVLAGGDLRSEGEGPGIVGNPLLILAAVVGLGLATAGMTALLTRLARRR